MTQTASDLLNYLAGGVLWASFIEDLDSRQPVRALGPYDIRNRLRIIAMWPILLLMLAVSLLTGPPPGGGPNPTA